MNLNIHMENKSSDVQYLFLEWKWVKYFYQIVKIGEKYPKLIENSKYIHDFQLNLKYWARPRW